jgi:hypothetical protein
MKNNETKDIEFFCELEEGSFIVRYTSGLLNVYSKKSPIGKVLSNIINNINLNQAELKTNNQDVIKELPKFDFNELSMVDDDTQSPDKPSQKFRDMISSSPRHTTHTI